jgi:hypothetical protein
MFPEVCSSVVAEERYRDVTAKGIFERNGRIFRIRSICARFLPWIKSGAALKTENHRGLTKLFSLPHRMVCVKAKSAIGPADHVHQFSDLSALIGLVSG